LSTTAVDIVITDENLHALGDLNVRHLALPAQKRSGLTCAVIPVLGGEVEEGEQRFPVLGQTGDPSARFDDAKGALSAKTAKLMVFKLVKAAAKTWRRLKEENQLPKVVQGVKIQNRIEVTKCRHYAA
jgi:hypothetical protein